MKPVEAKSDDCYINPMANPVKPGAVLFAKDVERLATFYATLVPMTMIAREDGAIRLEDAAIQLVIHALPARIARTIMIAQPPVLRENTAVKLVFAVDDLARIRAEAPGLGGGLKGKPAEFVWQGFRACDGHDPEGNVIQFRMAAD